MSTGQVQIHSMFRCDRCNTERSTPFCPMCGERLTDNQFIGHDMQQLESEYEEFNQKCTAANDRIQILERKHGQEMEPAVKSLDYWIALRQQISEAKEWARKNDIQRPDCRK
jgi:hypothetical protein